MNSRRDYPMLDCPSQNDLDWMLKAGIDIMALAQPEPMMVAHGVIGSDGRFDPDARGQRWFAIEMPSIDDIVLWQSASSCMTSWSGRASSQGGCGCQGRACHRQGAQR
jgi:hypothetical protein